LQGPNSKDRLGGYMWRNAVNYSLPPSLPTCSPLPHYPRSDSKDRVGGYTWRNGMKSIAALHKPRRHFLFTPSPLDSSLPSCSQPLLYLSDSKDRVGGYTWRNGVKSIVAMHKPSWPACQDGEMCDALLLEMRG
ncbi:unnamed protein product, partial [Closterium sp. NIES-64]